MSNFVEKTFGSFQNLVYQNVQYGRTVVPAGLQSLVHLMASSPTKQEEERIITYELGWLQQKLSQPNQRPQDIRECLVRSLYCEMMGYPTPFSYIHSLKLAQQGSLHEKRLGYLAATLFLHENHELVLLLINTVQKDLKSSNVLDICMALSTVCALVNNDMVPTVLPLVEEKLKHPSELVRKKAVVALHRFILRCPSLSLQLMPYLRMALEDTDPSVVFTAAQVLKEAVQGKQLTSANLVESPDPCSDLVPAVVTILRQVIERKLPTDFDFHGYPAPWLQIVLLELLAVLGRHSSSPDGGPNDAAIEEVVGEVLRCMDLSQSISCSIVYHCGNVVASIQASPDLVSTCMGYVAKFLRSHDNNLKYCGISAVAQLVRAAGPSYAAEHQSMIMECLYHPDESVRKQTLNIMYSLGNSSNVQVICAKMLEYLSTTTDEYLRQDLVEKVSDLVEHFSPDLDWHLQTVISLLLRASHCVSPDSIYKLMDILRDGSGEPDVDLEVRQCAVRNSLSLLQRRELTPGIVVLCSWLAGEYVQLCPDLVLHDLLEQLVHVGSRVLAGKLSTGAPLHGPAFNTSTHYRSIPSLSVWVLDAIQKMLFHIKPSRSAEGLLNNLLAAACRSEHGEVRQLAAEISRTQGRLNAVSDAVVGQSAAAAVSRPLDLTMSFLDAYVVEQLQNPNSVYKSLPPLSALASNCDKVIRQK